MIKKFKLNDLVLTANLMSILSTQNFLSDTATNNNTYKLDNIWINNARVFEELYGRNCFQKRVCNL